jgi:hypothetical protein
MGLIDDVIGVIGAIFALAIGVILMQALYPVNPFMAIVGIILLLVVAIVVVIGFARSHGR